MHATSSKQRISLSWFYLAGLLALHSALLAHSAVSHSHVADEMGHLAGGLSHWKYGNFEVYRVNPHLVRVWACTFVPHDRLPIVWQVSTDPKSRPEFRLGHALLERHGMAAEEALFRARLFCIPISVLAALVCFFWGRDLFGVTAGCAAATLWCFCPNVLGHASLITPDTGAAAFGLLSAYCLRRYLKTPSWPVCCLAGFTLGIVEITKTSWIILFAIWPLLILTLGTRQGRSLLKMVTMLVLALFVVNLSYGFQGTGTKLGEYKFVCSLLKGENEGETANRFKGSLLGELPVPLPKDYVLGIDLQRFDFERKMHSYLLGEWRLGGWLHYYVVCAVVKVPVGTLILIAGAAISLTCSAYRRGWREECILGIPPLALFCFVSSQTGFSHHSRYVLPCLPFAFVFASRTFMNLPGKRRLVQSLSLAALIIACISSMRVYPHGLSYFNELAGGPENGHWILGNSNTDWGQDLLLAKQWIEKHPHSKPPYIVSDGFGDPRDLGINCLPAMPEPRPGWFLVSVNKLHDKDEDFAFFQHIRPVDRIGYSMLVYEVSQDEANRLRRSLGMSPLP